MHASPVLEDEFAKLLASQIKPKPIDERMLEFKCKFTMEELDYFVNYTKLEIQDTKLLALTRFYLNGFNTDEGLFEKPCIGLCGCLGPLNGDPECACKMRRNVYQYRYHIARDILKRQQLLGVN